MDTVDSKEASRQFLEWASLFSGKLFVMAVYADESGTHDPTFQERGSVVPIVAGYIDTVENWAKFCKEWESVLNDYGELDFHYCDTAWYNRLKSDNRFHAWPDEKVDDFIYDLAMVVTKSAVTLGGHVYGPEFIKISKANPQREMLDNFFRDFEVAMNDRWRDYDETIDFIFDQRVDDEEWERLVRAAFYAHKAKDSRLGALTFADRKQYPHWPLQAADMNAYTTRRVAERYCRERREQQWEIIDLILQRNMINKPHEVSLSGMDMAKVEGLVQLWRQDEKKRKAQWREAGEPKRLYYPRLHFPTKSL